MSALFLIAALFYLVAATIIGLGLLRAPRPAPPATAALPRVSVIVAARNEEADLPRCLASLAQLDYPADRIELILVDDCSTDATRRLMEDAAPRLPNARVLTTAGLETHLRAKARPLALGAAQATGEWLFILDADAEVGPGWLRAMLAYAAPDVGIIGGPFVAQPRGLMGGIECAVEAYLMAVPFGVAGLGGAPIASGPNMAIRRDAYEAGGGLEAMPHEVAEDMALLKLAQRAGLRAAGGAQPKTTARVAPVGSLPGLLLQQKRWILGGVADAPAIIKALVFLLAAYAWSGSVFTLLWWRYGFTPWALAATVRFLGDAGLVAALAHRTGLRGLWRWLPLLEVYIVLGFLVLVPWCVASPRPRWRGASFEEDLAVRG